MTKNEAKQAILKIKEDFGNKLVILGHHYQRDDIVELSDYVGDSLELARRVTNLKEAKIIIFCGVYFMAETAAILAPDKDVYIPDKNAGCPLADMANIDEVLEAWEVISKIGKTVVPIAYINSSAAIKSFCGQMGGTVCTSGNSRDVFRWALKNFETIFFLPDRNLGRNTAYSLNIEDGYICEWDSTKKDNLDYIKDLKNAKVILWNGYCPVHWPIFSVNDIKRLRGLYPNIKIIVHQEADPETVKASDCYGSTAKIINFAYEQREGTKIAIGTEYNLVNRLADKLKERVDVLPLKKIKCEDMERITIEKLASTLINLDESEKVVVDSFIANNAVVSIKNMLKI